MQTEDEQTRGQAAEPSPSEYTYFWKADTPFSQWQMSGYVLDGVEYVCSEQGMMHGKALLFGDLETADLILQATSPRKMKSLGQKVKNFSEETWEKNRWDIVYRNNVAKFTQNAKERKILLNTKGLMVEASPFDKIWGIGMDEEEARKTPPSDWNGLNLLWQILTQVREEIRSGVHDDLIKVAN